MATEIPLYLISSYLRLQLEKGVKVNNVGGKRAIVLQAAGYSLLPEAFVKNLQLDSSTLQASALADLVHWFQKEVRPTDVPRTFSAEEETQVLCTSFYLICSCEA